LKSYKARILEVDPSVESQFVIFENENRKKITDAFSRAAKDPFPTIDDMHDAVYLEEGASA
jgi:TPP-dependent pyruvate/acetoin dehydrogenase alpha subunit